MAEKQEVARERVRFSGIFDYPGAYSFAHSWLYDEKLYGVIEERYNETVKGNARDIFIQWKATRTLSDYFRIELRIKIDITGLSDVEAEIDGEKKKMNRGKIEVDIRGILVRDPYSKWDTTPVSRFFRDVYNKYIIPGKIETMEQRVATVVKDFKDEIKAFLELSGKR